MNPVPPTPRTPPRRICADLATLPLQLVVLTQDMWPDPPAHPIQIVTRLRCALESHEKGPHFDLVRELDDSEENEVWAQWKTGRDPSAVTLLRDCPADNGAPGGAHEACVLFAGHPGGHSYEFTDPEYDAIRDGGTRGP
ncbi:hypothetical protein [Streptomyces sp. NPDC048057]|uniref:hypothetical protein n=1 Tax=Streptomyces sp. NPDC048057 TaxID=3155628 RepID=UPI0033D576E7